MLDSDEIEFHSRDTRMRGTIHWPPGRKKGKSARLVVQGPGWLGTRCSWVDDLYHDAFVAGGYAVLTFDHRGTGESHGDPKWVDPNGQIEDLHNAITYGLAHPGVQGESVALWGLASTGAGNAIVTAANDERVSCLMVQAVIIDGERWLRDMRSPAQWRIFLARLAEARLKACEQNEHVLVDPTQEIMIASPTRSQAGMSEHGADTTLMTADLLLRYKPIDVISRLGILPTMIVGVEGDDVTPHHHAEELFGRLQGPKRILTQLGVDHYSAYRQYGALIGREYVAWLDAFHSDRGRSTPDGDGVIDASSAPALPPSVAANDPGIDVRDG